MRVYVCLFDLDQYASVSMYVPVENCPVSRYVDLIKI